MGTNPLCECWLQSLLRLLDSTAVAMHIQKSERRRRFINLPELATEECLSVICLRMRQRLRNVVTIGQRLR